MTFGQRLKELRKAKNLTQNDLSLIIKMDQSYISQYENDNHSPSYQFLQLLKRELNVNINWILDGNGAMFLPSQSLSKNAVHTEFIPNLQPGNDSDFWNMRVEGDISAGEPIPILHYEPIGYLPISKKLLQNPKQYWCFRVNGDSMTPEINHLDHVLICNKFYTDKLDGRIIAAKTPDGITLKKLLLDHKNKQSYLFPINSVYKPVICDENHTVIGYLKLIIRMFPD